MLDVTAAVAEIRADHVHGAGWLARRAVLILGQAISESHAADRVALEHDLRSVVADLLETKPAMAPIANLVCRLGYEVLDRAAAGDRLASLRQYAARRADELAAEAEEAVGLASACAVKIISSGASILTCSYSSSVLAALAGAGCTGRPLSVLVARSWDGRTSHGERLAHELSAQGLIAKVVPDSSLETSIRGATLALIGADAVLSDASVVNGYPSRSLAEAAGAAGVPLYCVCESLKLDARPLLGSEPVIESGFELVPASLVSGFCTELGLLHPHEIAKLVPRMALYLAPFFHPSQP